MPWLFLGNSRSEGVTSTLAAPTRSSGTGGSSLGEAGAWTDHQHRHGHAEPAPSSRPPPHHVVDETR